MGGVPAVAGGRGFHDEDAAAATAAVAATTTGLATRPNGGGSAICGGRGARGSLRRRALSRSLKIKYAVHSKMVVYQVPNLKVPHHYPEMVRLCLCSAAILVTKKK